MSITVTPLNLGTIIRDKSGFTYMKDPGVKINVPIISWLVEVGQTKIIVDTGTNSPLETAHHHQPLIRNADQELSYVLQKKNVSPQEIEIVILTHLHWDHCYNTELFPNAQFIVQEIELSYAMNPLPIHAHAYDIAPIQATKFTTVNGNAKIIDGITLLLTPGHTPGFQSVFLENEGRKALIASDTIPLYENWAHPSPIPNGAHYNLADYCATFDLIKKLKADYILPGHDMEVFQKEQYVV